MTLTVGDKLGPYEIVGALGAGGMGEVYRARDPRLGRDVAIKVSAQQFSERFDREARVIASLNHPNICCLYDIGPDYLVMELVEGPTLAECIKEGPIPVDEALSIAKQIADALDAAHEKGITHRDLKPANIKVKPDGLVKVLDFGLAKIGAGAVQAEDSPTIAGLTQAGVIMGTPAYMSPEQAKGKAVDKRSDIWAFGVVLYEMLTGAPLFHGETFSDTLAAVLRHEVDWKPIPVEVEPLLKRCLERDPKVRLRDIGDAWPISQQRVQSSSAASVRKTWLPWVVAVVSTLALTGVLIALWPRHTPDRPLIRVNVDVGPDLSVTSQFTAVLSPDGTELVYRVQTSEGKYALAIRSLDQKNASILAGTENFAGVPFFSPDGQWIGFATGGQIKKVPLGGGAPVEVASQAGAVAASWGKDGYIVAAPGPSSGLIRIPDKPGAMPERLTELAAGEITHRYAQVLPDANAIMFTTAHSYNEFDDATIQVVPIKGGKPQILVTGGFAGRYVPSNGTRGHLIYVHQGTLFAIPFDPVRLQLLGKAAPVVEEIGSNTTGGASRFDFSTDPSGPGIFVYQEAITYQSKWQMLWLDSSGKTQALKVPPGSYPVMRLSPDASRVALVANTGKGVDVLVYDIQRDRMSQLTLSGQNNRNPVWAPDGKHVVFSTDDGIWWTRADGGSDPQLLLKTQNQPVPSSFSPDGKFLAYAQTSAGTSGDIWILPLDLSNPDHPKAQKPEVFLNSPAGENLPAFSPDGHWLAYVSSGPSGDRQEADRDIWVRPFPNPAGKRWQVSTDGGNTPIWSRTGSQLFFEKTGGVIMVTDYIANGDSFAVDKPHPWSSHTTFQPSGSRDLDLAPDGKHMLIFDRPVGAPQPITHLTFLINFFDELRRRAPEAK